MEDFLGYESIGNFFYGDLWNKGFLMKFLWNGLFQEILKDF
jgi:hypothetical protein